MKAKEAMRLLGVSKMTLHNYVKTGKIKIDKKINSRNIVYNNESVYKFANEIQSCNAGRIIFNFNGKTIEIKMTNNLVKKILKILRLNS